MAFRSSITIVASPRPRVGKTLLARLLTDFHLSEGRLVTAFDLNAGERTLAQFLPEKTTTASVREISGQMALFDHLVAHEDVTKVIDLGHESFESFFSVAHQIDFIEEARRRSIAVAILFTITPDQTSIGAYRGLRDRFSRATLAPLHNEYLGPHSIAINIRLPREVRASCACRLWRPACADTSRRHPSHLRIRGWTSAPGFRRTPKASFSAGYAEFIWSFGNSICAYYWLICGPPSSLAPEPDFAGNRNDLGAFLPPDFPRACRAERKRRHAMWITLFTIVIGIALCFGFGAMAVQSYDEKARS
jgi:hypothetical protein